MDLFKHHLLGFSIYLTLHKVLTDKFLETNLHHTNGLQPVIEPRWNLITVAAEI